MSKYTTGEIAKLCGVSVRTVQYYDTRGILTLMNWGRQTALFRG
ncbi:MAG: MerR family DNA-binding transcriptional regulator [Lachnospiraceae bacterium]